MDRWVDINPGKGFTISPIEAQKIKELS